jgi:hypothetical protein
LVPHFFKFIQSYGFECHLPGIFPGIQSPALFSVFSIPSPPWLFPSILVSQWLQPKLLEIPRLICLSHIPYPNHQEIQWA